MLPDKILLLMAVGPHGRNSLEKDCSILIDVSGKEDICGIPMVIHTYNRALFSKALDEVYTCTDSIKIAKVCEKYKAAPSLNHIINFYY